MWLSYGDLHTHRGEFSYAQLAAGTPEGSYISVIPDSHGHSLLQIGGLNT
jgi:hypothetical protein